MQIVRSGGDYRMRELLESIRGETRGWRALHFRISRFRGELSIRESANVAENLIHGRLKEGEGAALFCEDGDIILLCKGVQKRTLDELSGQLSFLFSGAEDCPFQELYDLGVREAELHALCAEKILSASARRAVQEKKAAGEQKEHEKSAFAALEQTERDAAHILRNRRSRRGRSTS
jgi:hypothetical protein